MLQLPTYSDIARLLQPYVDGNAEVLYSATNAPPQTTTVSQLMALLDRPIAVTATWMRWHTTTMVVVGKWEQGVSRVTIKGLLNIPAEDDTKNISRSVFIAVPAMHLHNPDGKWALVKPLDTRPEFVTGVDNDIKLVPLSWTKPSLGDITIGSASDDAKAVRGDVVACDWPSVAVMVQDSLTFAEHSGGALFTSVAAIPNYRDTRRVATMHIWPLNMRPPSGRTFHLAVPPYIALRPLELWHERLSDDVPDIGWFIPADARGAPEPQMFSIGQGREYDYSAPCMPLPSQGIPPTTTCGPASTYPIHYADDTHLSIASGAAQITRAVYPPNGNPEAWLLLATQVTMTPLRSITLLNLPLTDQVGEPKFILRAFMRLDDNDQLHYHPDASTHMVGDTLHTSLSDEQFYDAIAQTFGWTQKAARSIVARMAMAASKRLSLKARPLSQLIKSQNAHAAFKQSFAKNSPALTPNMVIRDPDEVK